jgi:hypothetical protein
VVFFALVATCGVAWQWGGGSRYLLSAVTAWGLCWFAALLALVIVFLGRQMGQGVGAVLMGMGIRMALPLAAAIFLSEQSPIWGQTKLMPFLLGNYFLALIVETGLAVHLLGEFNGRTTGISNAAPLAKPVGSSGELAPKA